MLTLDFIKDEATAIDFVEPTDEQAEAIRVRAEDFIAQDDYLMEQLMNFVDQAIFDEHLEEA